MRALAPAELCNYGTASAGPIRPLKMILGFSPCVTSWPHPTLAPRPAALALQPRPGLVNPTKTPIHTTSVTVPNGITHPGSNP